MFFGLSEGLSKVLAGLVRPEANEKTKVSPMHKRGGNTGADPGEY